MQIYDLFFVFIAMLFVWGWWWDRGIKQYAFLVCKKHCAKHDLQLLDDTVQITKFNFQKDNSAHWKIYRQFSFEFTSTSEHRYTGTLELLGKRIHSIELAPYQI